MTTATGLSVVQRPEVVVRHVPIPPSRDPFINTPLVRVKRDERGVEWFWISTYNSVFGCLGLLVSEWGEYRIYRFTHREAGFYSAVVEDDNTLWLCGTLDRVVRLSLDTGAYEEFPTGAPSALVFQGMAFDRATGKLFAAAFPPPTIAAFSFDTRTRQGVKVYQDFSEPHYMRCSFPNGDGTYSIALQCPGETLLRWDPAAETLTPTGMQASEFRFVSDDAGRYYFPHQGWYDPADGSLETDSPRPEQEMTWFANHDFRIYGAKNDGGAARVCTWDPVSGHVATLCTVPDCYPINLALTESGSLVGVNMYGVFYRFDGRDGTLELCRVLPTDAVGYVDCLCRIDERRLLGTPFITQRFWEVDVETGAGFDCGRAAPGGGEVLRTWNLNGKIYLAAYTGGELVEYDPAIHPHFPENPHVVADPPGGMRPIADADDGRCLYYACSSEYGTLGSTVTRYDTETGRTTYTVNPLPDQQICSLGLDRERNVLLCGTTFHADCQSCKPSTDQCFIARLHAETLAVEQSAPAPVGTVYCSVMGPLGDGRWLYQCHPQGKWFALDPDHVRTPADSELIPFPAGTSSIYYAGRSGLFLILREGNIELWDIAKNTCLETLVQGFDGYRIVVQDDSLYLAYPSEIMVIDHILA